MATQSPFPSLDQLFEKVSETLQAPAWLVDEVQHRLVLLLNHVLMQESMAQERLVRQSGKVVLAQWRNFQIRLQATPAGLLDRAQPSMTPDLTLTVTDTSPLSLVRTTLQGQKPAVSIEGDVQLAGDVNWLVEHVRWDLEEDLSRIVGDAPAHAVVDVTRRMAQAIRQFAGTGKGQA